MMVRWMGSGRGGLFGRSLAAAAGMGAIALLSGCQTSIELDRSAAGDRNATSMPAMDADLRNRARIRTELAAGYYQQRNYQTALDEVRQAIALDGDYAPAHGVLALIRMDLGESAAADESFKRALKIAPRDAELNNNYGWFLCQNGKEQQAFAYFKTALTDPLYRTPALALANAGLCAMRVQDESSADAYFRRALQSDPNQPLALFHLSRLHLRRGEVDASRALIQRLNRTYEPSAEGLWLELRVARMSADRATESSLAAQLRRRFPNAPETARLNRGQYDE